MQKVRQNNVPVLTEKDAITLTILCLFLWYYYC